MNQYDLENIIDKIFNSVDDKQAYFGFEEYTPHEFCIKANKDGLKTFAAELLELSKSDIEGTKLSLSPSKLTWYKNELDVNFVELTTKSREELLQPKKKTSSNNWLTYLALGSGVLLLIYLIISGIIFTIQLI